MVAARKGGMAGGNSTDEREAKSEKKMISEMMDQVMFYRLLRDPGLTLHVESHNLAA